MARRLILALLLLLSLTGVAYADRAKDQSERLDEILRLVREDVSDAVIVKHIEASGFVYDLSADDILELRQLGMSDVVIEALLDTAIRDDGSNRRHRNDYDDEDWRDAEGWLLVANGGEEVLRQQNGRRELDQANGRTGHDDTSLRS